MKLILFVVKTGLFAHDHMAFEVDRKPDEEPSIVEMTEKAIELLEKGENGYFLLVEGELKSFFIVC
jgi:alkaline phosphatase